MMRAQGWRASFLLCARCFMSKLATCLCAVFENVRGVSKEGCVLLKGVCFLSFENCMLSDEIHWRESYKMVALVGLAS